MSAPLFNFNRYREDIEREVVSRVVDGFAGSAGGDPGRGYQLVLNDAAFHEINRLEKVRGREAQRLDDWKALARRIGRMTAPELRDEVRRRAAWYAGDVAGHRTAGCIGLRPPFFPSGWAPSQHHRCRAGPDPDARLLANQGRGPDRSDSHADWKGTLVVPTHSSNLDSIVLGWSLVHSGLPPCTYGAGKNLFINPLIGYFMRNLGAYRVDRRCVMSSIKKSQATARFSLNAAITASFRYPSRSGAVEQRLQTRLAWKRAISLL